MKFVTNPLQTPTLNGPADHVAFVIHGIGQVNEIIYALDNTNLHRLYRF